MSWVNVELDNYVDLISGPAFKSALFTESEEDIPLVKGDNISQGYIDWKKSKYWPNSDVEKYSQYWLEQGDVILAMDRPWVTAGLKYSWIKPNDPKALLVQRVARMRGKNGLSTDYLRYVVSSKNFSDYIKNIMGGTNVPHISGKQIKSYAILLPPEPVQAEIVRHLTKYDNLIENNKRRIALLEESARQLYKEWFVRFRFPGHEHVKIIDGVPEGWSFKPLKDIASLTMGQSPKSEFYNSDGDGLPFHQGVTKFGFRFVEHETFCTKPTRVSQPGDILFSVRAPVGRMNITNGIIVLGRGLSAIHSVEGVQSFLFYALKSYFFKEDMIGGGAIYASVTKKDMENQELLIPPGPLLKEFNDFGSDIDKQIYNFHQMNMSLTKARNILLPKLMNGEITV